MAVTKLKTKTIKDQWYLEVILLTTLCKKSVDRVSMTVVNSSNDSFMQFGSEHKVHIGCKNKELASKLSNLNEYSINQPCKNNIQIFHRNSKYTVHINF